jgi:hypothetical protein
MAQGVLPYKYEEERKSAGTSLAGLPIYLDLAGVLNVGESIARHLPMKTQGWTGEQIVLSLILLNLAGGDCINDLRILEADEGFRRILAHIERKNPGKRWRKKSDRCIPSPSAVFRYLSPSSSNYIRGEGKAVISPPTELVSGLERINCDLISEIHRRNPTRCATLDMDATLIQTEKSSALFSYKGYKAYQPLNTWWAEQSLILHTEFRDGNVPAGYEQLRVLKRVLPLLPHGIKTVRLRSDTAGYQHEVLKYCNSGENERFGRIEFAIGCDVTPEFRKAAGEADTWRPLSDKKGHITGEWAEVCFVPAKSALTKKTEPYRYIAIRELLKQQSLPGMDNLPFQTVVFDNAQYKLFGIVTNMDLIGDELIRFYHDRCGKSEEAHSIMKEDLAGGKLPSASFDVNAAWWWIMILSLNLNQAMKTLVLKGSWSTKRMKAIRFHLINLSGRIVERSRQLFVRITRGHPSLEILLHARHKIMELALSG